MEKESMEKESMKIKELLELTKVMPLADIAKTKLPYGEKKVRILLNELGCEKPGVGKRGWTYNGDDPAVLEKDISEFLPSKATPREANNKDNASTSKSKKTVNKTNKSDSENDIIEEIKNPIRKENNMISEIQALIKGTSKDDNARIYKGIYFDKDIAAFLDNVQHGNKSEIVNKILRQYLVENELM